jgi:2-methylisocitrate lyase-like PEP mutase family enzyme
LQAIGVARVTVGSSAMRAAMGLLSRLAAELKGPGTYEAFEGGIPHSELNRMMS